MYEHVRAYLWHREYQGIMALNGLSKGFLNEYL